MCLKTTSTLTKAEIKQKLIDQAAAALNLSDPFKLLMIMWRLQCGFSHPLF